ncbi:putative adenylyltransferase/sulfurtransferase MoeZ [mine drainage metagenome]|uniref:Putative adenylyltransferase/sulfurtransferase MoeZ n=1 Tax=mine drainage metagenome TaxID=410659 RepID=A0A1J5QT32_9ZZZZ
MKRIIALSLMAAALLSGCSSSSSVKTLDAQAFSEIAAKSSTYVLDVRTPGEFIAGHLVNAHNIDVEASNFGTEIAKLDKNATYAVYCHSGNRSAVATAQMAKAGFDHIYDLNGGILAWASAGGALVTN